MDWDDIGHWVIGVGIVVVVIFVFWGYKASKPVGSAVTSNPEIPLSLLFEHEGCSIYRFYDAGNHRYFADCRGSISSQVNCGKNCTTEEVTLNLGG